MSQRDGFGSGFLAGAIIGGVVGGIVGAAIASRRQEDFTLEEEAQLNDSPRNKTSAKQRQMRAAEADTMDMEMARRSLEDKIAQLNSTIDEVRQQLGNVNSNNSPQAINERASL